MSAAQSDDQVIWVSFDGVHGDGRTVRARCNELVFIRDSSETVGIFKERVMDQTSMPGVRVIFLDSQAD